MTSILAALAVLLVTLGIWEIVTRQKRLQLAEISGAADNRSRMYRTIGQQGINHLLIPLVAATVPKGAARDALLDKLDLAGVADSPEHIYQQRVIGVLIGVISGGLLAILSPGLGLAGILIALLGWILPISRVNSAISRRQKAIANQTPQFADMVALMAETGAPLLLCVEKAAQALGGPLGDEALRMSRRAGQIGTTAALREMSDRLRIPELDNLITTLLQAQRFGEGEGGIRLADALRGYTEATRQQERYRLEEASRKRGVAVMLPVFVFQMLPMIGLLILPMVMGLAQSGFLTGSGL